MKKIIRSSFGTNKKCRKAMQILKENEVNISYVIRKAIVNKARRLKKEEVK